MIYAIISDPARSEPIYTGMKIAIYIPLDMGKNGGIEKHILNLADCIAQSGEHVDIYCRMPAPPDSALSFYDLSDFNPARYDIIHGHSGFFCPRLSSALKTLSSSQRHIHTSHNAPMDMLVACRWWWNWRAYKAFWMEGYWAKKAHHVIAVSERVKTCTIQHYHKSAEQVTVIPNGHSITPEQLTRKNQIRACLREQYAIGERDILLLFIGRSEDRVKGSQAVVEAVSAIRRNHQNVILMAIPGTGFPQYPWLIRTGSIDHNRIYEYYFAADIFINSSLDEGHPLTLVEAMACGLPVIASPVGGIPDTIRDGDNGLLLNPARSNLIERIVTLLENLQLREKLVTHARQTASTLTWETIAKRTITVYNDALESRFEE
jgi:glycosyltransferase involved in cell wall biosynthesis